MIRGTFLTAAVWRLTSIIHHAKGLSLDGAALANQAGTHSKKTSQVWDKVGDGYCTCDSAGSLYNRENINTATDIDAAKAACAAQPLCTGITWAAHGYDQILSSGTPEFSGTCGYGPPVSSTSTSGFECWALGASATGDPHLQNIHGQRFDLMKPGKQVLINIPRWVSAENALFRVEADAHRLGGSCADIYFRAINVTGLWADAKQAGGYHYNSQSGVKESPGWLAVGKVEVKISHGHTQDGILYLNFYVKHMGRAGSAVGGLLGEDDHQEAATPTAGCVKELALSASKRVDKSSAASLAAASLA
jgi:hypothetical protein